MLYFRYISRLAAFDDGNEDCMKYDSTISSRCSSAFLPAKEYRWRIRVM